MKHILKSIGYIVLFFAVQILVQMVLLKITYGKGVEPDQTLLNQTMLLTTILANFFAIGIVRGFLFIRKKPFVPWIDRKNITMLKVIVSMVSACSFSFCFNAIVYHMTFENETSIQASVNYFSEIQPHLGTILMVITLLIAAPLGEEFFCRGLIIPQMQKRFSDGVAIFVSAAIFGIMHIAAGGGVLVIGAGIIGLICGIIYVKTNSLLIAFLAHATANAPDFVLRGKIDHAVLIAIAIFSFVIFVVSITLLLRMKKGMRIEKQSNCA